MPTRWRVDADALVQFVRDSWPDGPPDSLRWSDLALAHACGNGTDAAVADFLERHASVMQGAARKINAAPDFVAEATASLQERLLAPRPDAPRRIATYRGRGSLADWVAVAATRNAINLATSRGEQIRTQTDVLSDLVGEEHPELRYLAERYADEVNEAVRSGFEAASEADRKLLRMHYVDGIGLAELGALYGVHKSTMSRRIARVRDTVLEATCASLSERIDEPAARADSLLTLLRSRIDITLSRVLQPTR